MTKKGNWRVLRETVRSRAMIRIKGKTVREILAEADAEIERWVQVEAKTRNGTMQTLTREEAMQIVKAEGDEEEEEDKPMR